MFRDVYVVKPESSRSSSAESFVVGLGFYSSGKLAILSESLSALKEKEEETVANPEEESKASKGATSAPKNWLAIWQGIEAMRTERINDAKLK